MKHLVRVAMICFGCAIALGSETAAAQTPPSTPVPTQVPAPAQPPPPPKFIAYRGMELGVDVTAARQGEVGFHFGAASTHSVLSVRVTAMDEGLSVPCSVGVMYEYLFGNDRARITPVAGASLGRVFSCASDADGPRPSPDARSVATISGGLRIPMFAGHRRVGSLKVLAFSQHHFGLTTATDTSSMGVTVGFVVGRR